MRLLTESEIIARLNETSGELEIENFSRAHLQPTAYYVRLSGAYIRISDGLVDQELYENPGNFINLAPSEYIRVQSFERFRTGRVLGFLGGASDNARRSLNVSMGLSIDPFFGSSNAEPLPLEFGLKNESKSRASIPVHDIVAKVVFFDVADAHDLVFDPDSLLARKVASRKMHAMDAQLRAVPSPKE